VTGVQTCALPISTFVTLGSLVGVVWIIQALKGVDIITTKGQTLYAYFALTSLAVPMLIMAVIPLALLIATVHTINTLNANTELVVINASGASSLVIAKPLLALALVCSLVAGSVGHFISPMSLVSLKKYSTKMKADLVSIILREGSFNQVERGLTFHVAKRGEGGLLQGILIADDRDANTSIIYSASKGIVTREDGNAYLLLQDGEIQQSNLNNGSVTIIKYQSYVFDLSSLSGKTRKIILRPKERTTPDLLSPDPNDKYYQKSPGRYRSQIHERFSEMLWPFAYVLVILAFAGQARSSRQSYGASIGTAIIMVMIARGMAFSAVSASKTDPNAVIMIYLLPIFCMAFGAWFVLQNKPVSLPRKQQKQLDEFQLRLMAWIELAQVQYIAFRRRRAGLQT